MPRCRPVRLACGALATALVTGVATAQEAGPETSVIEGRVLDDGHRPIAGACVAAGTEDTLTTARALAEPGTRTGRDGRFELAMPVLEATTGTAHFVLIVAPGKASILVSRHGVGVPHRYDLGDVRLPDGVRLRGRIRGEGGRPLPGARVFVTDRIAPHYWRSRPFAGIAVAKNDGSFELPCVLPTGLQVKVHADGYYSRDIRTVDARRPLGVGMIKSGFVEGKVVDAAGTPVRAVVVLTPEFSTHDWQRCETDVRGAFRFTKRWPCRYRVSFAWLVNPISPFSPWFDEPRSDIVLRLPGTDAAGVWVQVRDAATKKPIEDFRAAANWWPGAPRMQVEQMFNFGARRARAGRARLDGPGRHGQPTGRVLVRAKGYAQKLVENVSWKDDAPTRISVELEAASRIEGRVLDAASGAPVGGAVVSSQKKIKVERWQQPPRPKGVQTKADGVFRLEDLDPGKYEIVARRFPGTSRHEQTVVLGRGEVKTGLDVRLRRGARVVGRIEGAIGAGWRVLLERVDHKVDYYGRWSAEAPETSDVPGSVVVAPDGLFQVEDRAPGKERVFLITPAPIRRGAPFKIALGKVDVGDEDIEGLTFAVDGRLPGTICGSVATGELRTRHARFAVVATIPGTTEEKNRELPQSVRARQHRWCLVARDGSYKIPALPGDHMLRVADIVTGETLYRDPTPVLVAAGKVVARDLSVPLAELRVRFVPSKKDAPMLVERLLINPADSPHGFGFSFRHPRPFHGTNYGSVGLDLHEGVREVAIFVGAGSYRLHAAQGSSMGTSDGDEVGVATGSVAAGESRAVTIKVPPPPDLSGK